MTATINDVITREIFESCVVHCEDNGGQTADRYSVVFGDGDALCMSGSPSHPQGVSQWSETGDQYRPVDVVPMDSLPAEIVDHALARFREAWRDYVEDQLAAGRDAESLAIEIAESCD